MAYSGRHLRLTVDIPGDKYEEVREHLSGVNGCEAVSVVNEIPHGVLAKRDGVCRIDVLDNKGYQREMAFHFGAGWFMFLWRPRAKRVLFKLGEETIPTSPVHPEGCILHLENVGVCPAVPTLGTLAARVSAGQSLYTFKLEGDEKRWQQHTLQNITQLLGRQVERFTIDPPGQPGSPILNDESELVGVVSANGKEAYGHPEIEVAAGNYLPNSVTVCRHASHLAL